MSILVIVVLIQQKVVVHAYMDFIYLAIRASHNVSMAIMLLLRRALDFASRVRNLVWDAKISILAISVRLTMAQYTSFKHPIN